MTDILCYFIITFFIICLVAIIVELASRHFGFYRCAEFCAVLQWVMFRAVILGILILVGWAVGGLLIGIVSKVLN